MIHLKLSRFASALSRTKYAVKDTAKEIAKDVKRTATAANETLQDDFRAVAQAVADTSDLIDEKVRGTEKEPFHAAEETSQRAEMAHDAKESAKESIKSATKNATESVKSATQNLTESTKSAAQKGTDSAMRAAHSTEGYSEPRESMTEKAEKMAENVINKVKDTVSSVKETITGTTSSSSSKEQTEKVNPETNPIPAASINPMGDTPNRDPLLKPQKPLSKETEELQKEGAKRKAEEDSFNLM